MGIIFLIITVGIIYLVMMQNKTTGSSTNTIGESSIDVLKKRYGKGEITKDEFDRIKSDIKR